jgi:hypothetical protein
MVTSSQPGIRKHGFIKTPSNPICRLGTFVKSLVLCTAAISIMSMLSGCVGMMADSIARSMVTGKTYTDMAKTLPSPPAGHGRLYIYRTPASTHTSVVINIGLLKNPTLFTIDDTAYELIWEAFEYFDLPEGQHEITCGTDVLKRVDFWTSKQYYQKGTNKIQISISNASDVFVRVDSIKEKPLFQPVIVESEQARTEIMKLPYQEKQGHTYGGGKISESK